ncbi:MAG: hypothetical protein HY078_10460 [Elusimicrobia bacterium]|nr:hypothetical protein [Elusimicrobiota bacterium]
MRRLDLIFWVALASGCAINPASKANADQLDVLERNVSRSVGLRKDDLLLRLGNPNSCTPLGKESIEYAAITPTEIQINRSFNKNFGRNATRPELDFLSSELAGKKTTPKDILEAIQEGQDFVHQRESNREICEWNVVDPSNFKLLGKVRLQFEEGQVAKSFFQRAR